MLEMRPDCEKCGRWPVQRGKALQPSVASGSSAPTISRTVLVAGQRPVPGLAGDLVFETELAGVLLEPGIGGRRSQVERVSGLVVGSSGLGRQIAGPVLVGSVESFLLGARAEAGGDGDVDAVFFGGRHHGVELFGNVRPDGLTHALDSGAISRAGLGKFGIAGPSGTNRSGSAGTVDTARAIARIRLVAVAILHQRQKEYHYLHQQLALSQLLFELTGQRAGGGQAGQRRGTHSEKTVERQASAGKIG